MFTLAGKVVIAMPFKMVSLTLAPPVYLKKKNPIWLIQKEDLYLAKKWLMDSFSIGSA
ncbi:hypothetical protein SLEP1_g15652 [Rubroshorea leprosula]|uniref:Uncharacterized protein n=1 Tax=Rubroshorea leprosula TaxID=152421 RepID=A0AAV5IWZ8_9ROSI|nr:hypothetical protein SLEP1_g15652 [Rubroshorea leprosula]